GRRADAASLACGVPGRWQGFAFPWLVQGSVPAGAFRAGERGLTPPARRGRGRPLLLLLLRGVQHQRRRLAGLERAHAVHGLVVDLRPHLNFPRTRVEERADQPDLGPEEAALVDLLLGGQVPDDDLAVACAGHDEVALRREGAATGGLRAGPDQLPQLVGPAAGGRRPPQLQTVLGAAGCQRQVAVRREQGHVREVQPGDLVLDHVHEAAVLRREDAQLATLVEQHYRLLRVGMDAERGHVAAAVVILPRVGGVALVV